MGRWANDPELAAAMESIKDPGDIDWQRYYNTTSGKGQAASVSTQPSAAAASNRASSSVKKAGFMGYVDAFNQGMYNITAPFVAHPIDAAIDVVKNTGIFAWDMGNAITGVSLHVSTEGSRIRNAARGKAMLQDVIYGDGLSRTEWATEMVGGAVLMGGVGSATGLVLREGIAATRASRLASRTAETTLALEPALAEVPTITKGTTKWGTASAEQVIANRMTPTVSRLGLFGNRTVGVGKTLQFEMAPRVTGQLQDSRLGRLAGKLDANSLNDMANNPKAQFLYDTNTGHINVVQNVEGKLLRITVPRDTFKIISVGPIQERNLVNSINNGRFLPIGNQLEESLQIDSYMKRVSP